MGIGDREGRKMGEWKDREGGKMGERKVGVGREERWE